MPAPPEPSGPCPPSAVTFRVARRPDVARVVGLVESAYRGEASRRGWTTEADLLGGQRTDAEAVDAVLDAPATTLVLALDAGTLVGCCALSGPRGGVARLSMLAVAPDRQRSGLGQAIVEEAVRRARHELGAVALELAVLWPRGELRAWYARRGFAETGRTEPFPYGDERYGLPVRDDLFFVVLERPLDEAAGA